MQYANSKLNRVGGQLNDGLRSESIQLRTSMESWCDCDASPQPAHPLVQPSIDFIDLKR